MTKERPSWHASCWHSEYDWETNKQVINHDTPVRCPYCGHEMCFSIASGYGSHSSDSYWFCPKCALRLPNLSEFPVKKLDAARRRYRKQLETYMREAKEKFKRVKNLYNEYGRYFTPEEKRDRLIETIEEHGNKDALQE